jgi:hypothetical protein
VPAAPCGRRDSLAAGESRRVPGDIVLVNDHPLMLQGSDKNALITIDIEDKVTALAEDDTEIGRIALISRTTKNMIGEFSNYASVYLNRIPQKAEQKQRYDDFLSTISVTVGKSIDRQHCRVRQ